MVTDFRAVRGVKSQHNTENELQGLLLGKRTYMKKLQDLARFYEREPGQQA